MGINISIKFSGTEQDNVQYIKTVSDVSGISDLNSLDKIREWIDRNKTSLRNWDSDASKVYRAYAKAPYDGQMRCGYCYVFNNPDLNISKEIDYSDVVDSSKISINTSPIMLNYKVDTGYGIIDASTGLTLRDVNSEGYSFYKREYNKYSRYNGYDEIYTDEGTKLVPHKEEYEFIGEWEPAAVLVDKTAFRDFNVKSGHSYQYILYPANASVYQIFANHNEEDFSKWGRPVVVNWADWSIAELIPIDNQVNTPSIKATYKVDLDNIWKFKYSLETGDQKQNLTKNQIQTLGQYPKISQGRYNAISGSVRCLLGSEIIPYYKEGYVERTLQGAVSPTSTDERVTLLEQWRKFAYSKNPKLLRDIKGQSWIVQIMDSSNTPQNFYNNQPDTISFSWTQIGDTEDVIIYGDSKDVAKDGCLNNWEPKYK